jgi:hypothetical protein
LHRSIRNPHPVAFVKQANIANGPQQVNNGAPPAPHAHAGESRTTTNGLLERCDGEWLDTGAAGTAGRSNPALEAVGKLDGASD